MSGASEKILEIISVIRRCWLRRQLSLLVAWAAVGLLLWLGTMVLLDNWLILSPWQLMLGWIFLAVVGVAGLAAGAYRLTIARPSLQELAICFESRLPAQHNRLINSVDFIENGAIQHDAMARAAVIENALRLDATLAPKAIDWQRVRRMFLAAAGCLLFLLGYAALRGPLVVNAIQRLLRPTNPLPHLLLTEIAVAPGDANLVEGDSLAITASLGRHLPSEAFVEYRVAGSAWTRAAMHSIDPRTFRYDALKGLWQDLQYRVLAGRSASRVFTVTVRPRPKVQAVQISITPPAYTGAARRLLPKDQGDVTALEGSRVHVDMTASTALSSAKLELSDGTTVPLNVSHNTASGDFVLKSAGSYAIVVADQSTPTALVNLPPPTYSLTIQEDQPPVAVFSQPGRELILPADATVELKLDAEDDCGLAAVSIETKSASAEWKPIARMELPAPGEKRKSLSATIALADYRLKSGDLLLYRAVAVDHRQPTPNTFVGRPWSISIGAATADAPLLAAEAKKTLETLQAILVLQKEARSDVDMDRDVPPIRQKQSRVRQMTITAIDQQRQSIRPSAAVIEELTQLADGPMVKATALLADFSGAYQQRQPKKQPILKVQDEIISRLEELIGRVGKSIAQADKVQQALERLSPEQKEQALQQVRDMLAKLRDFIPEQDKVIQDTRELLRKADNFTRDDLEKLERLKGTEDQWAKVFAGSVDEMNKLLQQGFADATIANDYKEMVEQIEEAAKNLNPPIKEMVVPREQTALELATAIKEDMEMWLPATPDDTRWVMEEPLSMPDVPMPPLPENLRDMIGDLIAEENDLTEAADDQTSSWADSPSAAGWMASDGPISSFSARGITGNQLPNNQELSGRAGDGRSGKSSGQMVENIAKGLEGRQTPTRVTNDPYEQGVVKELQQMKTGGATGGGKARGAGQEGLQGTTPPPNFDKLPFMKDWQQRIRQKAERLAGQLTSVRLHVQELDAAIESMKRAESAAQAGRYGDMFKAQQMVIQQLQAAQDLAARDAALRLDRAYNLPADRKRPVLDPGEEPVPTEYHGAVRRYFEQLSREQ